MKMSMSTTTTTTMKNNNGSVFVPTLMKGKTWFISGGGTGIGLGIAKQAGKHGANVFIGGRREDVLREACKEIQLAGAPKTGYVILDVRDPAKCLNAVTECVKTCGSLDVLVNNAAGNFSASIEDTSINGFKTVLDIDLFGTFNMSKAALEELKKAGNGVVINISATLYYKAMPFQMHASSAKAAIDVMGRVMGVEWAEYGIRCVSIAPGPIEGTVGGPTGRVFGGMLNAETKEDIQFFVPTGRWGTVEDIANAALFVASPAGSYINSTEIVVDGGHWHDASRIYHGGKELIRAKSQRERKEFKGGVKKPTSSNL